MFLLVTTIAKYTIKQIHKHHSQSHIYFYLKSNYPEKLRIYYIAGMYKY